jgi:hypothetical protein
VVYSVCDVGDHRLPFLNSYYLFARKPAQCRRYKEAGP